MFTENRGKIEDLKKRLGVLEGYFNLPAKRTHLEELDKVMGASDFWDDSENAQRTLKERALVKDVVESCEGLRSELEDTEVLAELSAEESDEEVGLEAQAKIKEIELRVESLEFKRLLGGENDEANAIVSINAGAGGTEAQDWAEMVLRMYTRYGERGGFEVEMLDIQPGDEAGIKSAAFIVKGPYACGYLQGERGVHRLVRISPFDSNKRRHTSFCSVFVSPEIDDSIDVEIDEKDLRVDTFRASGAGGQHVNKTDSAVRITHIPTGLVVSCQNERSQHQNRFTAMKILRSRLYDLEVARHKEKLEEIHATKKDIAWGNQIRSYVLHPYRMIKDHRTGYETGNVDPVLDGDLSEFIKSYLLYASEDDKQIA
ncbi:MAG: peptide chain release factor 2 [Thermodesulfobacteriota bacterium]